MDIPAPRTEPEAADIAAFLDCLKSEGFAGDIAADEASRLVSATDNSIYQVLPAAVIHPRNGDDLNRIVRLAASGRFGHVTLTARGGGTGTNGQSLTNGVVIDTSRHMNRIGSLDADRLRIEVEPGVVLDQLNAHLAPHDLFFPPTVSTATRATIGGMVATDASGKGSRIYGKTSDHVEAMDVVLADGSDFRVEPLDRQRLEAAHAAPDLAKAACAEVLRVVTLNTAEIARVFPNMNRGLTGYNLQGAIDEEGRLTLHRLLAGSEGTLALTKKITLCLMRKPRLRALAVIRYSSVDAALCDVGRLIQADPLAVEFLDEKVIALARQDVVWNGIGEILGGGRDDLVAGMNFVEFVGDHASAIERQLRALGALLSATGDHGVVDWKLVSEPATIAQLWTLREKSVGLLGKLPGTRQGVAFVEDAAVPPEKLPGFVRDFRAILDGHGLDYGMYGHADVGCLHVRPLLDLRVPEHAALVRPISDAVAALAKRYGGLLWGEHGRGFRGEYSPTFFGPTLYAELCRIKAAFDPDGVFNPGKLAVSSGAAPVDRIDAVPLRAHFDATIMPARLAGYEKAVACNGNGVCFSWDANEAMCPSYKVTHDRTQSPKGRAALLREWARRRSLVDAGARDGELPAFERQVHSSLSTCLSCRACANQCPVQVDIPAMKSRFLAAFHANRSRRLRDYAVAMLEDVLPLALRIPKAANAVIGSHLGRKLLAALGLVDLPPLVPARLYSDPLDLDRLTELCEDSKRRTVILIPDGFTSAFDRTVPEAAQRLLEALGYDVYVAPLHANGKALHVLGFLGRFASVAKAARERHLRYSATGVHVVGVESVTVLMDRHEYRLKPGRLADPPVQTLDEFLAARTGKDSIKPSRGNEQGRYRLFLHCTEKTAMPDAARRWVDIFEVFGLQLTIERTGCCGMSGLFGHESEHVAMSRDLFDLSWRQRIEIDTERSLVTGFSCRCQTERLTGKRPRHPIEVLDNIMSAS